MTSFYCSLTKDILSLQNKVDITDINTPMGKTPRSVMNNAIQTNMAQKYVVQKMSNIQKSSNKNGSLNFGSHDKLGSETLRKI